MITGPTYLSVMWINNSVCMPRSVSNCFGQFAFSILGQRDKPFVADEENELRTPRPDLSDRPYASDYSGESYRKHYKVIETDLNSLETWRLLYYKYFGGNVLYLKSWDVLMDSVTALIKSSPLISVSKDRAQLNRIKFKSYQFWILIAKTTNS